MKAMADRAADDFAQALAQLPEGYVDGLFNSRRWSATLRRSGDGRRTWLFAQELGGSDIVSFNHYRLAGNRSALKPCEMSSDKVIDFVLHFRPSTRCP